MKMLTELGETIDEQSDNFNKELENMKKENYQNWLLLVAQLCLTLWTAACQASLFFIISWSLLKLMPIECVITSNHLILCHPRLLLPSIFPSIRQIGRAHV